MVQLKELNENLQKQSRELAISNAELEQFAYVASHDLQEPLRMITSFLARLEEKYENLLDRKGKQYIHFATDGAKRMRQLILDLLEFSRAGRTEVQIEKVNLNQLIKEILGVYQIKIAELNAKVNFELLPTFRTYKTPLMQVFQNLIGNSLKYHKSGVKPVIDIGYTEKDFEYEFSVRDNGIGIGSEFYDKIFVVFQRLHNKDEYSGTGMGLAITKKIVENMGGRIWVDSTEGMGSTFYFTIPKNS
jgi:light-regulated signal transduction histidine kinase (bacteriophytochrome)